MRFLGFQPDHFKFFEDLTQNNKTSWFREHRSRYDEIVETLRALVDDLAPFLLNIDPNFEVSGKIGANLTRINRDIRFSKDKSPYKKNLYVLFYRQGLQPKLAGRLYVGLTHDCVTVGFSMYAGEKENDSLHRIFLPRTQSHPDMLAEYIQNRNFPRRFNAFRYVLEKREWREADPYPESPSEWLRTKGFVVRKLFPSNRKGLNKASFLYAIQSTFLELVPLYLFASYPQADWEKQFVTYCKALARNAPRLRKAS